MTSLPDPRGSRVVLAGVSQYQNLEPLNAIRNNITELAEVFCNRSTWGLPIEHCAIIENPSVNEHILDPIVEAAKQASDTLIVYYAGHGLIEPRRGSLHLALVRSHPERIYTAVPFDQIRDVLLDSKAARRVVILDSCYSARAFGQMADVASSVADEASSEGTYLMAAAAENKAALAQPGEKFTAFTGELLQIMWGGVKGGGEILDLDTIYRQVYANMKAKGRPIPQKRDRNTAGQLGLVRNRADRENSPFSHRHYRSFTDSNSLAPISHKSGYPPSELRDGRYTLAEVIGRGEMSEVRRARDTLLNRTVAVKTLHGKLVRDAVMQSRFRREAEAAASLNHPSIVAIHDIGVDEFVTASVPYIVMEFVNGPALRDVLKAVPRLHAHQAAGLIDGVLRALDYSHRSGIVHRDIRPGNVMISKDDQVKVADFGVARAVDTDPTTMSLGAHFRNGAYLSPEQAIGERVDSRSDLYSAGCLMYQSITGHPPFGSGSWETMVYRHLKGSLPLPSELLPEMPKWVDKIVAKALEKNPDNRYQSAQEMLTDVRDALGKNPVTVSLSEFFNDQLHPLPYGQSPSRAATGAIDWAQSSDTARPVRADDFADILPPVIYPPKPKQ